MTTEFDYYTLEIEPCSDDHINVMLRAFKVEPSGNVTKKVLFTEEYGSSEMFVINDEFKIDVEFESAGGWHTIVGVLDEDKLGESWKAYEMKLVPNSGHYGFSVFLKSFVPIGIAGKYGDQKSKILALLAESMPDSDKDDHEELYKELEKYFK